MFTSTYFDTKDYDLARVGITLRRRVERDTGVWQLTFSRGQTRKELEISQGSTKLPLEFVDLLFAFFREHMPTVVTKLRTDRQSYQVWNKEQILADISWDRVTMLKDRRICKRFHELEVALVHGMNKTLKHITAQLASAGAEYGSFRPQMCQALDLEYPEQKQVIEASLPIEEHVRFLLRQQTDDILRYDPGTRLGTDPEDLHQMRVASRRSREILRTACPLLDPGWHEVLVKELDWLIARLGAVRDFDVLLHKLRREMYSLTKTEQMIFETLLGKLESQRSVARISMLEELQSQPYLTLLDRLCLATQQIPIINKDASLQDLAKKAFDKLEKSVDNLPREYTDQDLHRLRIRAKRARYAAEFVEHRVGKDATQFIRQVRKFQDLLGEHQDTVIIERQLQNFLRTSRHVHTAFTTGVIVERLRRRRTKLRAAIPQRWKKLKRRGKTLWR